MGGNEIFVKHETILDTKHTVIHSVEIFIGTLFEVFVEIVSRPL